MSATTASAARSPQSRVWRRISWIGAIFILAIAAMAVHDIYRGYQVAVGDTGRELDLQARVLAEQAARSLQTVDRVLANVVEEYARGALASKSQADLHAYLRGQAVGLSQVEGLSLIDASGRLHATSISARLPEPVPDVSDVPIFQALRVDRRLGLSLDTVRASVLKHGAWIFPVVRRLETPDGVFAGVVVAGGRVDYFQQFYRDIRLDEGTIVTLMHRNGTLVARHPPVESALGRHFPLFDAIREVRRAGDGSPWRVTSPIDGVERFGALESVPEYPLAIAVTRDVAMALAAWRHQALGTTARTLALGVLAAALLAMLRRQFVKLDKTRESLEVSRERFALAAAGSDVGIWDWHAKGNRIYASPRARELFGAGPGPEEVSRDAWFASVQIHPDDVAERREALRAHLAGATPVYAGEYRVRGDDGAYRWIRVRGLCVRDAAGEPLRMAGSVADVDARRRAEEALRESEERFALAVAGSNDGILDWDVVNDRMYSSPRTLEMLGIDSQLTLRTRAHWRALLPMHPDDQQRHDDDLRMFMEGDTLLREGDYRVRRGDGEYRWVRVRNLCVRDAAGKPLRLAGSVSDIDAYKRVEAALRESEERYALAMTGSNEGHWVWDIERDQAYASPRMNQILGLPEQAWQSSYAEYFARIPMHPQDRPRVIQAREEHLAGAQSRLNVEYRIVVPGTGEVRWIQARGQVFRDAAGKPLKLAGSIEDISERKRTEEALRQSENRFALAVEGSDDGVWDFDYTTNQAFASRRARELNGMPLEPEIQPLDEYYAAIPVHPDDQPVRLAALQALRDGLTSVYAGEWRCRQHDGEYRWVRVRGMCVRDATGTLLRMAGSVSDIDARKRTEEALRQSEQRFATAVAGSDDGVWEFDYTANRAFASRRARQIIGLPLEPEVQTLDEWFDALPVHPDDVARRQAAMQAHLDGLTPAFEGEWRSRQPDGRYRWVRVRGVCVRDASSRPLRMAGSVSDIDARKCAQESLRRSEERYALAVAGSDDGVWDWDYVSGMAFESARARELQALPPGPELQPISELVQSLRVHPDDAPRRAEGIRAHLAGETPAYECDYRVRHDDGQYRWIHVRALCIRDAAGDPVRMAGSVTDIDARKKAEEALRQSEERFALAVAGSNDGILDWDIIADRMYVSERALSLVGLDPATRVSTRTEWATVVMPRFHPDDAQRLHLELRGDARNPAESHEGEYRVRAGDGSYRWLRFRGRSVRDATGRPIRWAGSVSDVNALKQTEAALRVSEERYELAVAGSNEGMWDWDMRKETFFLSTRAQQLFGLEPGEPMRPCHEWWTVFQYHPEDEVRVREAMQAYLDGAGEHWEVEYRIRHGRSGDWHWYRERGVALRDAAGKPYRMAGSLEDISARKRAEAERQQLEVQLRQAQKLEAIGTLAGGIAHDFNNILAAILGYAEMVQKDSAEGSAQRRHIDAALSAGMRAKSLVERILAFSRSGMGERVPVHVQSVVAEALDAVAASLPAGIALHLRLDAGDAAVTGDPTQVHQVVMNLCANAVQAMKTSGTLTVSLGCLESSEPHCTTGVLASGNYVRLRVRDTGTGIAPQVLERIFDPFFTTKEVGVGTGLGLSLVHGIVTDLGGGIDVQSENGAGSTFTVYLPWQGNVTAPVPLDEAAPPDGNGQTILLIDDEEPLVRLGEEMIAELGYEPVGFTSSKAALATFRAEPQRFNAVLSDEAMPEMTGSELIAEIRKIRPDIPIVMMSGYVTAGLSSRAREAGVAEVLSKPLVSRDIARSLASALRA